MNRKGMVATLDAVIFVAVLAIVSVTLVTVDLPEESGPDASDVCDSLSSVKLPSELIAEDSGGMEMNVWDIAAASMNDGDTEFISDYIEMVVHDLLTGRYPFEMSIRYNGSEISFGEGRGEPISECDRTVGILGGTEMRVRLVIYG